MDPVQNSATLLGKRQTRNVPTACDACYAQKKGCIPLKNKGTCVRCAKRQQPCKFRRLESTGCSAHDDPRSSPSIAVTANPNGPVSNAEVSYLRLPIYDNDDSTDKVASTDGNIDIAARTLAASHQTMMNIPFVLGQNDPTEADTHPSTQPDFRFSYTYIPSISQDGDLPSGSQNPGDITLAPPHGDVDNRLDLTGSSTNDASPVDLYDFLNLSAYDHHFPKDAIAGQQGTFNAGDIDVPWADGLSVTIPQGAGNTAPPGEQGTGSLPAELGFSDTIIRRSTPDLLAAQLATHMATTTAEQAPFAHLLNIVSASSTRDERFGLDTGNSRILFSHFRRVSDAAGRSEMQQTTAIQTELIPSCAIPSDLASQPTHEDPRTTPGHILLSCLPLPGLQVWNDSQIPGGCTDRGAIGVSEHRSPQSVEALDTPVGADFEPQGLSQEDGYLDRTINNTDQARGIGDPQLNMSDGPTSGFQFGDMEDALEPLSASDSFQAYLRELEGDLNRDRSLRGQSTGCINMNANNVSAIYSTDPDRVQSPWTVKSIERFLEYSAQRPSGIDGGKWETPKLKIFTHSEDGVPRSGYILTAFRHTTPASFKWDLLIVFNFEETSCTSQSRCGNDICVRCPRLSWQLVTHDISRDFPYLSLIEHDSIAEEVRQSHYVFAGHLHIPEECAKSLGTYESWDGKIDDLMVVETPILSPAVVYQAGWGRLALAEDADFSLAPWSIFQSLGSIIAFDPLARSGSHDFNEDLGQNFGLFTAIQPSTGWAILQRVYFPWAQIERMPNEFWPEYTRCGHRGDEASFKTMYAFMLKAFASVKHPSTDEGEDRTYNADALTIFVETIKKLSTYSGSRQLPTIMLEDLQELLSEPPDCMFTAQRRLIKWWGHQVAHKWRLGFFSAGSQSGLISGDDSDEWSDCD